MYDPEDMDILDAMRWNAMEMLSANPYDDAISRLNGPPRLRGLEDFFDEQNENRH